MKSLMKYILLKAVFSVILVYAGNKFRCDYTYVSAINGWLKYHEMPSNWNEARLRCHMEGAALASPLTPELKQAMLSMKQLNCEFFTGIHATFSRGDFAAIEGVPLSKINHTWEKNEPDNYKDEEDCLMMLPNGNMADVKCEDTFPYFCYKKMSKPLTINACGTSDPEYHFDSRTGKCYKFHKNIRTWSRAYMTCMAEGAYLTVINSQTESTVLKDLFAKNPPESILGTIWKDTALIGFHDWTEHGEWRTIQGQTLEEAGFSKFAPANPDNTSNGEFCGSVFRTGLLNDIWCEVRIPFICEKELDSLTCDND